MAVLARSETVPGRLVPHRVKPWWAALLLVALAIGAGGLAWQALYARQLAADRAAALRRMQTYAASLGAELARHEALPGILALDRRLSDALRTPNTPAIDAANDYLREAQRRAGIEAAYLMNRQGLTLAASNHGLPDSFVGQNYAFRPYMQAASRGMLGRFYAVGATTGRAGYFLAAPILGGADGAVVGVVAVKVSLDDFEELLARNDAPVLLSDERGVVLLASQQSLRYRTLGRLDDDALATIKTARQYEVGALMPLDPTLDLRQLQGAPAVPGLIMQAVQVVHQPAGPPGWQLSTFVPESTAWRLSVLGATTVVLAGLVLASGALAWQQRQQRRRELLALDKHIRQRIDDGTRDLQQRLVEQQRTEALLRQTTDAAVQAGKLAVLGQMAAGLSHELNQPLTALRNYTDNALTMLAAGRTEGAARNLAQIAALAERMGSIVSHMRSHARKQPEPARPVSVREALDGALALLRGGGQAGQSVMDFDAVPADLQVQADAARLEQVLLNLLRNAAEAAGPRGHVSVQAGHDGNTVAIAIRDDGPGIAADAMPHLFEPFFTTKAAGQGLGLGLAVSRMIAEGLGGSLNAANGDQGGAVMTLRLPAAPAAHTDARGVSHGL